MEYDVRKTKAGKRVRKHRIIYRMTVKLQYYLWLIGIAWHNRYSDECTPDFNCCEKNLGRKVWLRL